MLELDTNKPRTLEEWGDYFFQFAYQSTRHNTPDNSTSRHFDTTPSSPPSLTTPPVTAEHSATIPSTAPTEDAQDAPMDVEPTEPTEPKEFPVDVVERPIATNADGGRVLVFDTETANLRGLVIQLAYNVYDSTGRCLEERAKLLTLPQGETIGWGAFRIHKISVQQVAREGVDPLSELAHFARVCAAIRGGGGLIVAHNASFDCRAVRYTWSRHAGPPGGEDALPKATDCSCTMQKARGRVPVTDKRGILKAPSNTELYTHLFKVSPENDPRLAKAGAGKLHDAAFDIAVTAQCYLEGRRRRWWM